MPVLKEKYRFNVKGIKELLPNCFNYSFIISEANFLPFLVPVGLLLCSANTQQLVCLVVDEKSLSSEHLLHTAGLLYLPNAPDYLTAENTT